MNPVVMDRRYECILKGGPGVLITVLIWVLLTLASAIPVAAAETQILTPRDGKTILARDPETRLVLRQASGARMIRVQIGETTRLIDPSVSMEGGDGVYRHYRLPLKAGTNRFLLVPAGGQLTLEYQPIQSEVNLRRRPQNLYAFHQDGGLPTSCSDCHVLSDEQLLAPVGLPQQPGCRSCHSALMERGSHRHSTTDNQQCLACHQQSLDPWRIGLPSERTRELCLGCHTGRKSWFESKSMHGPINLGGCTLCHDPHGSNYRQQLWADGALELCIACHSDMAQLVAAIRERKIPYVHNVLTGPGCVVCHDPHASDQIYMLKKPINELCAGCHPGPAQAGGHPVARHPVIGPSERLRPGRALSCTSCHEPHGSYNRHLLIETNQGGRLCRECHGQ